MIVFNLDFLNTALAVLGILGWGWVWTKCKYKTGSSIRVQIGMILLGIIWVMLFTADTVQDLQPTSLTVLSRAFLLTGLWCCMPLLKRSPQKTKETDAMEVDYKEELV